ncbi:MAG: choice-of-anchor J domain-containing protein, partial [candidate division WOR-3 bacterium]
ATQTSIPVSYETDAGRVNETWTGTLLPGAVAQYTFTTPYTPADSGLFRMWAGTGLVSDTFNANDSLSVQFRVCLACHSAPYLKDFNEAWANSTNPPWCGWTIMDGGSDTVLNSNDWHRFERTSPPYRTVANIYYSPVEWSNDWLISPRLDCSVNGTYTLRFWHYYNDYTTGSPDSGLVLLSTDGGTTWPIQLARYSNADDSGYKTFDISAYVSGWDSVKVAFWYVAYDEMYWDIDDFLVSFAPLAPQLLSPGQDSLLSDNIPWFDWSEPAGANKYWFQLASDSLFTTRLFDDSSVLASEYQIATALPDGRYFWRVRASAGLWSEWTGTWRFGLDATAPAAPVLLAPPNHALVTTRSPCLTWGSVTLLDGATRYRVQVADDSMFGSPLVDAEVTDTSYIPAPLPEDIPLYWHVMATDTAGNPGSYSEIWEFTIDATAPSAPVLIAPANHATLTETKPTFIWSAASGEGSPVLSLRSGQVQLPSLDQVSYRLLCDDDPLFLSPAINVLLAETSYTPLVGLELGRWFWRVLALDSAGNAGPSETWDFTISALPLGWVARASVPEGPKAKKVKDGGCLGYIEIADSGLVYALKGNNRCEFYSYNPATYVWATKESIPILGSALKKKAVKRGGALVGVDVRRAGPRLLALKGNNSLEFWQYCPDTTGVYLWVQKPDVPAGARAIKEGSGLASVRVHHPHGEDSSFVFLLKGSGTNEFYRFSVQDESWTTMAPAPGGASGKPYKNGSCLTASEDGATVYCLKGSYNEFASYDVATNTWSTLAPLPLTGSAGRKKAKDGAALACAGGLVYALKGGNTLEFWQYKSDTVGGPAGWTEIEAIPTGSKKVKGGRALVYAPKAHGLFALKGNNTLEFYQYAFATVAQANDAQNATMGASKGAVFGTRLAIAPNPFSTRTTIRYTLSSHCLVSLGLYDLSGALVRTLANGTRPAGSHTCVLIPGSLPRGVYLLRLCVGPVTATEKLILE